MDKKSTTRVEYIIIHVLVMNLLNNQLRSVALEACIKGMDK